MLFKSSSIRRPPDCPRPRCRPRFTVNACLSRRSSSCSDAEQRRRALRFPVWPSRLGWLAVGLAVAVPIGIAAESEAEEILLMTRLEVRERAYGKWGIGINLYYRKPDLVLGGAPKSVYVTWVQANTPAHREGIEAGDEILKINGQNVADLYRDELYSLFYESWGGSTITLSLHNPFTGRSYEASMTLPVRRREPFQPVFWGVQVMADGTDMRVRTGVVAPRRWAEMKWANSAVRLAQQKDGGVKLTDGNREQLLSPGVILTLKTDGQYDVAGGPWLTAGPAAGAESVEMP